MKWVLWAIGLLVFAMWASWSVAGSNLKPLDDIERARAPGQFVELPGARIHYRLSGPEGAPVIVDGRRVGTVTSGGFSPSLQHPIAMAYVDSAHAGPGTELSVEMRGKLLPALIVAMPFVAHRYHRSGDRT